MAIDLSALDADSAVTAIYIGYYNRAPDPEGLAFWTQFVDDNDFGLTAIATLFAAADETQAVYPFFSDPDNSSASAVITSIYNNLFERDPDDDGLAFWTGQLEAAVAGDEGAISVGEIITSIIEGAQGDDITIVNNKIEVALDWTSSLDATGATFELDGDTGASAKSIIADVDETDASVVQAKTDTDTFIASLDTSVAGETFILTAGTLNGTGTRDNLTGTEGSDTFEAFNAELQDGDRIDGGSGTDVLFYFNSDNFDDGDVAKSPITTSVEHFEITNQSNDLDSYADNNVGGYNTGDGTVEVDVEIDGGLMSGVTRWEDHDSRADVVIEDARDLDDTDGTFTGDITVAMVSTDPGNVDFAVYFDQPVNVSQNFGTLELRVLDQEAAASLGTPTASSTGFLTESSLISFKFDFDGTEIEVTLPDEQGVTYGANVSFQDLLDQVEIATQQALVDAGVTDNLNFTASLGDAVPVGVGSQSTLPLILTFNVSADSINASSDNIVVLGRDQDGNDATDTFGALTTDRSTVEELIRLNVELDDVGKGSMGGDALFGAMSTGRQEDDDGTSDSIGIQRFDIEVDRSSQLQTINSTNNSLEVVNIINGENDGRNNTTTAADEMIGSLTVRGQANTAVDVDTDSPMPGAVPQHNLFGFSDVGTISASSMVGALDITAELTEEIVEKYLDIQDDADDGEADDVDFTYALGTSDDEFLMNLSAEALAAAGTGSREDFDFAISGNSGGDVITTNVGSMTKSIDEQGQDYYVMTTANTDNWYFNSVFNTAATLSVDGGTGNDVIYTHGWGDFEIIDGAGTDVIYTDNSGAVSLDLLLSEIDRNIGEHTQIDYDLGGAWIFNGEEYNSVATGAVLSGATSAAEVNTLTGITNDTFSVVTGLSTGLTFSSGTVVVNVAFEGLDADASEAYTGSSTITLGTSNFTSATGTVSIDEQTLNQAIKDAVNNDPVLSVVLEAVDGPGNSLIVYSKIDGDVIDADTLNVSVGTVTVNTNTATGSLTNTAYTAEGYLVYGDDSVAESDNVIDVTSDNQNDVYVLSTDDTTGTQPPGNVGTLLASELNGASNEVIEWDDGFGTDTVFNFDADATTADGVNNDEDVFDFSAITGGANTLQAFTSAGDDVVIATVAVVDAAGDSDGTLESADVIAYFNATGTGGDTTASEHILIAYDINNQNGGNVWHITDGSGASDVTAVEEGTINLIGNLWTNITDDNIA